MGRHSVDQAMRSLLLLVALFGAVAAVDPSADTKQLHDATNKAENSGGASIENGKVPGHGDAAQHANLMGAVPSSGTCPDEGPSSTGNHCVKLDGQKLVDFQSGTSQNFCDSGSPTTSCPGSWCICLHLWADKKSSISSAGNVDCSSCSSAALSDANFASASACQRL